MTLQGERLESRLLFTLNPTALEQESWYDTNHVRVDPQGELNYLFISTSPNLVSPDAQVNSAITQFSVNTNTFLQQWAALTPTTPLAWNDSLNQAALGHNNQIIAFDQQSHQLPGEPPLGTRVNNAGYTGWTTLAENVYAFSKSSFYGHSGFLIDWGNDPPGHRNNIMNPDMKEVGISVIPENNSSTNVGPLIVTQNFGANSNYGNPKIVGVVFNDTNGNSRYTAGEGLSNITITVTGPNGTFATTTMTAGGYQLAVPAGTYTVTASGGSLGGTRTVPLVVTANNVEVDFTTGSSTGFVNFQQWVNTAPTLVAGDRTLGPVLINSNDPPGDTVADFIGNTISDTDPLALRGIAIVAANSANGIWQYSINGGSSWSALSGASVNSARLLRDTDMVRFVPNPGFTGTASISYRAWDQTSGDFGSTADLSLGTGGATAFSGGSAVSATVNVQLDNVAPTLASGAPTLATVPEDTTNHAGDTVSSLMAGLVTDPDPGAKTGMAVVATTGSSGGVWQYSLDGGDTWLAMGALSASAARLLRGSDRVRFLPNTNVHGIASLTFRAWDQTTYNVGQQIDLSGPTAIGGSTAFSSTTVQATATITNVNDAPVVDPNANLFITTVASTATTPGSIPISNWLGNSITDVDPSAAEGIAVIAKTGNGTWYFNTGVWFSGSTSDTFAVLLRASDKIGFVPTSGWTGTATITFRAWDRTSFSVNDTWADLSSPSSHGGVTAFSDGTITASIYVGTANASIQGAVYQDSDASGSQNGAETGLSGWTVFLDYDNDGTPSGNEPTATSDVNGAYTLSNLAPGTYRLREVVQSGWSPTSPAATGQSVTISAGQSVTGRNFGNLAGPSLAIADVSLNEGDHGATNAVFNVTLGQASAQTVTVVFQTTAGTATAGSDFIATSGTLTFAPGETSRTITIAILGDTTLENDETFTIHLSNPTQAQLADSLGVATIVNDDYPWHRASLPADVDGNGSVSAIDLVYVVEALNTYPGGLISTFNPPPTRMIDVNRDNNLSGIDLVLVVAAINGGGNLTSLAPLAMSSAVSDDTATSLAMAPTAAVPDVPDNGNASVDVTIGLATANLLNSWRETRVVSASMNEEIAVEGVPQPTTDRLLAATPNSLTNTVASRIAARFKERQARDAAFAAWEFESL